MNTVLETISAICLIAGCFFCLTGALGLLRFKDLFSRTHGAGIIDGLGTFLVLLGLLLQSDAFAPAVRLVLIFIFMLISGPTAVHSLARAALVSGMKYDLDDAPTVPGHSPDDPPEGEAPSNT